MSASLRMMARPSTYFVAQRVARPSFHELEQCKYLSSIARPLLPHPSRNEIRASYRFRRFSQSTTLCTESFFHDARMDSDRLKSPSRTAVTPYLNNKPTKPEARQRDAGNFDKGAQLPKQSSITTRILFQIIAPHVEFRTLTQLMNRLSKIELDQRDRAGKVQALEKTLDILFEKEGNKNLDNVTNIKYAPSLKAHPWIQPTIHAYFMGKKLDVPNQDGVYQASRTDPTYPPNRNRQQHQKNLHILMEARKVCLIRPMSSEKESNGYNNERHSYAQQQLEAEEMLMKLCSHLPISHFSNLMEKMKGVSVLNDKVKQNGPSSWLIDNDRNTLPERHTSNDAHTHDHVNHNDNIRTLCNALTNCSPTHSHLVADAFAEYFCLDLSKPQSATMKKKDADKAIDNVANPDTIIIRDDTVALKHQRELLMIEKKYNKKRDKFVQEVMEIQHIFANWGESSAEDIGAHNEYQPSTIETVLIEKDGVENDASSDLSVKEFKKAQEPYSLQTRLEQKEQLKGTLDELRKLALEKEKDGAQKKTPKGRGRPQRGHHIRFTAIRMEEKDKSSQLILNEKDASDERVVFLSNLPIDTTEDELNAIYSRCGQLDSIQIFNLRPDLDPGPLSTQQLKERLRMKKLMRKKNTYSSHGRPRTPVYAMLRFTNDEGYRIATSPELCIFGCVIRRHPVLSIRSHDINTIYLEQLPPHLFSIDVEFKLGELLYPHKFSVMIDGTQGLGLNGCKKKSDENYQEYSRPSSCQVRFVDYQAAAQAYQWISQDRSAFCRNGSVDDIQVHWFQTPSNSMDYWTRDLSF